MTKELKRSTVKPFMMGCLITAFMVSLGVNLMFYTGAFPSNMRTFIDNNLEQKAKDDQQLASVLGVL